jgi:hypothetical protein
MGHLIEPKGYMPTSFTTATLKKQSGPDYHWPVVKESATMKAESRSETGQTDNLKPAEIRVIHSSNPPLERPMTSSRAKEPLMKRLMRWIVPDQRVANRHPLPTLTAYLGLVRSSKQYKVGDISIAGFYMLTEERWILGTGFPVTLEREDELGKGQTLTVFSTVVRSGVDGVGFTFLNSTEEQQGDDRSSKKVDLTELAQFLKGLPLSEPTGDALERAS